MKILKKLVSLTSEKKTPTFEQFLTSFNLNNYIIEHTFQKEYKLDSIYSVESLLEMIRNLNHFFLLRKTVYISPSDMKKLYSALLICLRYTELDYYGYIKSKLVCSDSESSLEIQNDIMKYMESIGEDENHHLEVELTLRCFVEILDKSAKNYLNKGEVNKIVELLTPLWKCKEVEETLIRMREDY